MATNFPCPEPVPLCDQSPNPSTQYNSDADDKQTFVGLSWNGEPPRLGKHFENFPCFEICESTISQLDADLCAARLAASCPNTCEHVFANTAQTAVGQCPDDLYFYYTVAPGLFSASSQVLADRMALTFAEKVVLKYRVCLSGISANQSCVLMTFSATITATGLNPPYMFLISSGTLPLGIVLNQTGIDTVELSGIPTVSGIYPFQLEVVDSYGSYMRKNYAIQIAGIDTASPLSDGTVGTAYSVQLYSGGFSGTVTWTITDGSLPAGLTLDSTTGIISGTPTTDQDSTFTISATDGNITCTKEFNVHVGQNEPETDICNDGLGNLLDTVYGITGYFDGLIANPMGNPPAGEPVWDGIFHMKWTPTQYWVSGDAGYYQMDSLTFCRVAMWFVICTDNVPEWSIEFLDDAGNTIWSGSKYGGQTPVGIFNNNGFGYDAVPASVTISQVVGATVEATFIGCVS